MTIERMDDMDFTKMCMLVGRVAGYYEDGMSVVNIADKLDMTVSCVYQILGIILVASDNKARIE
jgi:hypothetical protein